MFMRNAEPGAALEKLPVEEKLSVEEKKVSADVHVEEAEDIAGKHHID